jgi:hypothetical protein
MQVRTSLGRCVVLACALFTPSACQLLNKPPASSAVAQGRYYSSGNPEYDAFFVELHQLQVELKDAPERAAEPRAALAKALDVGLDADVIKQALGKKASELGGRQVKFAVERPAAPDKPATLHVTGSPSGDDAELQQTLEQTLAKVSELKRATDGWQKQLEPLPDRAATLESGIDTAFADRPPSTRAEVSSNLSDGRKIIDLLVTRAKDVEKSNGELFDAITGALGEVPATSAEKTSEHEHEHEASQPPSKNEKKGKKSSPPPEKPSKPAKPSHEESKPAKSATSKSAAAKPAPKAPPKPAEPKAAAAKPAEPKPVAKPQEPKPAAERSEVPPPPKPTQGTAKPDFEP